MTPSSGFGFVLMPFSGEFTNQWELSFGPALREVGLEAKRADDEYGGTNVIMRDVTRNIYAAQIIIADVTGRNPNVMYELGLAHAAKKPVIILAQSDEDVPFDIGHIRYLKYDALNLNALKRDLIQRIRSTLANVDASPPDLFPELKIMTVTEIKELEYLRERIERTEQSKVKELEDLKAQIQQSKIEKAQLKQEDQTRIKQLETTEQSKAEELEDLKAQLQQSKIEKDQLAQAYQTRIKKLETEIKDLKNKQIASNQAETIQSPPEQSAKTRRNFLQWMGWGGTGIITGMITYWLLFDRDSPHSVSPPPPGKINPSFKTFNFEVVAVNSRGEVTTRESKSAKYFTAELGNGVKMDFVSIPGGKFLMGSPDTEKGHISRESPQHWVTISPFLMGKYQVTQAQWQTVMGKNPSYLQGENLPVENISWKDCIIFCNKLSQIIGKECRLPSEAEWEYACRAGTTTPFYFGETITSDLANYRGTQTYADEPKRLYRQEITPVGQFPPNAFGLYDMHGNVWEWCADTWHDNYQGAPIDGSAWLNDNDNNSRKVQRGGPWYGYPFFCRSASRYYNIAGNNLFNNSGFRVVGVLPRTP